MSEISIKQGLNETLISSINALLSGIDSKEEVINNITEYINKNYYSKDDYKPATAEEVRRII